MLEALPYLLLGIGAAIGIALFVFSLLMLRRTSRSAYEASVGLAQRASLRLLSPGTKNVWLEGPNLAWISGLKLTLKDAAGRAFPVRPQLAYFHVRGVSTARRVFGNCHVPSSGAYVLEAENVPQSNRGGFTVHFSPPGQALLALWVTGIALGACLGFGSALVLIILSIS